ncbi:MAG TPA: hypothetical protein VGL53_05585 [Bryobacteraceae bacterium]
MARHFWETALGLRFVNERDVYEEETREAWDIRRGALRVTRLEIAPEVFPKIELLEWEGCSGQPIRNAKHPWDYGLLALRIPVSDLEARLSQLAQWRCKIDRTGAEACVTTPTGERVVLRQGGEPAVIAVVPSIETSKTFFRDSLMLPNGIPIKAAHQFPGAATVDLAQTLRLGPLEVMEMKRSADPRPAAATEARMHAGFTGYCMLSVTRSASKASIELMRGPGGIPVEVITTASPAFALSRE